MTGYKQNWLIELGRKRGTITESMIMDMYSTPQMAVSAINGLTVLGYFVKKQTGKGETYWEYVKEGKKC